MNGDTTPLLDLAFVAILASVMWVSIVLSSLIRKKKESNR